jgi:glutamyl-Q tRNA(Asp) synthetase
LKLRSGANAGKSSTATATTATADTDRYVGRFAPTPSGDLHLGSLYTAAASFLDARAHGGRWLLRIEDLDRPREIPGSAAGILRTLEAFGFEWDGEPARQRDRIEHYSAAMQSLEARGLTFECSCSRLQLEDEIRYPGTCRTSPAASAMATATRLRVEPGYIQFSDRILGHYRQDVAAAVGDVILRRRDNVFAYLLSVVVDDAAQGVTHVVRGADLLDNTPRQIYLQRSLGLPLPVYAHVPVLTEPDDSKLAKSRRSVQLPADSLLPQLLRVFSLLGLAPPDSLASAGLAHAWRWAIERWDISRVPKRLTLRATGQQTTA